MSYVWLPLVSIHKNVTLHDVVFTCLPADCLSLSKQRDFSAVIMFSNNEATLTLYKNSLRDICKDYVIRFHDEQVSIQNIIRISSDIVQQLIDTLHQKDKTLKGRLVARVCYHRIGHEEEVMYYHPSYCNEVIEDANEFYMTHMLKIAQRMDDFNKNGSKLLIKNISEIHLHIACQN